MSYIRSLTATLFSFGAIQATQIVLPLLAFPWLGRTLGPDAFGLLMYMCLVPPISALFMDWGLGLGASRLAAANRGNATALARIVGSVFAAKIVLAGAIICSSLILWPFFPHARSWPVAWFLAVGTGMVRSCTPLWFYQGAGFGIKKLAVLDVCASFSAIFLIFIFIRQPEAWELYFFFLIICKALVYIWLNMDIWRTFRPAINVRAGLGLLYDTRSLFGAAFFPMLYNNGAQIILGFFLPAQQMGILVACGKMLRALAGAVTPIGQTIYPEICILRSQNPKRARQLLLCALALSFFAMFLAASLAWILAMPLIKIALGPDYAWGAPTLRLMLLAAPVMACGTILGQQTLVPYGHEKILAKIQAAIAIFSLPLAASLGYVFGMNGGAILPFCIECMLLMAYATAIWQYCPQAFFRDHQEKGNRPCG